MTIIHPINEFLAEIFPAYKASGNDLEVLKEEMEKYYTLGPYKPKVLIENDYIKIEIDTSAIIDQHSDFKKAVRLCDNKQYDLAKPILDNLINKNPTNSEYHRIKGQIQSEEGNQDEAIDTIIEALRWDPKNGWALIMMGNIFAKDKKDIETARIYYDQAIKANPDDYISTDNIALLFMQQGYYEISREYCEKTLAINPTYPNSHFTLSVIAEQEGDLMGAFNHVVDALKSNKLVDRLKQKSASRAIGLAHKLILLYNGYPVANNYCEKLQLEAGIDIEMEADSTISSVAKLELAENYDRDYHSIRYKSRDDDTTPHHMMHELVHLDFILQAQKAGTNKQFLTTPEHKERFKRKHGKNIPWFIESGLDMQPLEGSIMEIFNTINSQIFNTPIDLFVEQKIYDDFPDIRPYQFLSLYKILEGSMYTITDKSDFDHSLKQIYTNINILNLVKMMHYTDMYGINLIGNYKASKNELDVAGDMYNEYLEYRNHKEPGEEYELVANWAFDLGLDGFFELIDDKSKATEKQHIGE